jgi:hypothetical protein
MQWKLITGLVTALMTPTVAVAVAASRSIIAIDIWYRW